MQMMLFNVIFTLKNIYIFNIMFLTVINYFSLDLKTC